jgi:hypothetical protein
MKSNSEWIDIAHLNVLNCAICEKFIPVSKKVLFLALVLLDNDLIKNQK